MTGPEHAQAALDYLAEAKALATLADKTARCDRDWRETYSAQASACALIAAAEFQAAQLALQVVESRMPGLDTREAKEWRNVTGVV
ncbi:hypothetical protein AB0I81_29700 [Nonomuraea sp. NPDC050404]|uniref:hypothetical protein n=1 Tax=Nonomuraea sp. NPDC050404 TaxID=3155783 RepID=UPI0033CC7DD9